MAKELDFDSIKKARLLAWKVYKKQNYPTFRDDKFDGLEIGAPFKGYLPSISIQNELDTWVYIE